MRVPLKFYTYKSFWAPNWYWTRDFLIHKGPVHFRGSETHLSLELEKHAHFRFTHTKLPYFVHYPLEHYHITFHGL